MPRFDELLGVVTFAAAGMIAAVSSVPVPSGAPAPIRERRCGTARRRLTGVSGADHPIAQNLKDSHDTPNPIAPPPP